MKGDIIMKTVYLIRKRESNKAFLLEFDFDSKRRYANYPEIPVPIQETHEFTEEFINEVVCRYEEKIIVRFIAKGCDLTEIQFPTETGSVAIVEVSYSDKQGYKVGEVEIQHGVER